MPKNWKTYKLDDLCLNITDGAHSSPKEDINGTKLIGTVKDMIDHGFNLNQCKKISEHDFQKLESSGCVPNKGDVLFSKDGTIGKVLHYKSNYRIGLLSSIAIFRPNNELIDSSFLAHYLSDRTINNFISANFRSGSAIPRIILRDFKKFELTIPPLPEQKAIANILSAIDDKIENNLAINKTLEDMAMALYKHWFVDFGPFQEGEFIDSELGPIPKGWEVKCLDEVTTMFAGGDKPKVFSKEETEDLKIPIYSNGISNEGLYGFTDKARVIDESVTVSARGTIGYVCLRMEPFLPIVRLVTVVPNKEYLSNKYLFLCLKNQNIQGNGTTQQQLTVPDFKETRIIVPNLKIIKDFTVAIDSFYKNIRTNKKENQSLTQLRNTLLPKLISGEVRLKEFQEQVEHII